MQRSNHNWFIKYGRPGLLSALWLTTFATHAAETGLPHKVIVQKGDMLSSLLTRELGRSNPAQWKLVADFNNRTVNQTLEIGDVLLLPPELVAAPQVFFIEESNVRRQSEPSQPPADKLPTKASFSDKPTTPDTLNPEAQVDMVVQTKRVSATSDASVTPVTPVTPNTPNTPVAPVAPVAPNTPVAPVAPVAPNKATKYRETQPEPVPEQQPELPVKDKPEKLQKNQADNPPPKKPGLFEVDEESAVRALERSLIQLNALLLRPRRAEVTFSFDYSFNEEAEPILVTVEDTTTGDTVQQAGQLKQQDSSSTTKLDLKLGLPYESQINFSLPFSSINRDFDVIVPGSQSDNQNFSSDGIGDFALSVDKTLATESGKRPDLIFSATYNSDTGDSEIGSDAEEFSLGFNVTKRQDPLVFTASVSRTIASKSGTGIRGGAVTQFSIGTLLAASPYTSVRFLFTQASVASAELNGQKIPDSDATIASFVTGVSSVLGRDLFLNTQLSIGLSDQASDYRLSLSVARQFSF